MKDQLINFETAKLAKEKGFDEHTNEMYVKNDEGIHFQNSGLPFKSESETYEAPTQSLLQKWLREKHQIHCLADCNAVGWAWFIEKTNGTSIASGDYKGPNPESGRWDVYEEALEAGLQQALELL